MLHLSGNDGIKEGYQTEKIWWVKFFFLEDVDGGLSVLERFTFALKGEKPAEMKKED